MRRLRLKHLSPLLALALFALALLVMNRALGEGSYRDILRHLSELSPSRFLLTLALTAASYWVLTFYDLLATSYLGRSLGVWRTCIASFISYSFSRNIGFTFLTGGSIRYRFYSSWGLSGEEVTRLVGFAVGSFALGLLTVGGMVAMAPLAIPAATGLPLEILRPAGGIALALVGAYVGMVLFRRRPFRLRGWSIPLPAPRHAVAQILLGSLDWFLTAVVLYALLLGAAPITLAAYLQIYLLAQLTAIISHVPGGLGVFETVVLLLVPEMPRSELMGILLAYRAIYFLLPFGVAIVLLGIMEGAQHRKAFRRAGSWMGRWLSSTAPSVMGGAVLVSGASLLLSSVLPVSGEPGVPLWRAPFPSLLYFSAFVAGGISTGLLLTARGIQRRLIAAYRPTLLLLAGGILFSLPLVERVWVPAILAAVLLLLFIGQVHFDREFSFWEETFPSTWMVLLFIIIVAASGLLMFSHPDLIGRGPQGEMKGGALSSLWTMLGAGLALVYFWGARWGHGKPSGREPLSPQRIQSAAAVVAKERCTSPATLFTGGASLLFGRDEQAVLMYGREGKSWITLGDPVGPDPQRRELAWKFLEMCEGENGLCVFFDIGTEILPVYLEMGLVLQPVGDEAVVPLEAEAGEGERERHVGADFTLDILPPEDIPAERPALEQILAALGARYESRLPWMMLNPLALVRRKGRIVAFSSLCRGADGQELGFSPLVALPGESFRCFDFLFQSLQRYGAEEGFSSLSLGLVPLADWKADPFAVLWEDFAPDLFRHGAHFGDPGKLRRWAEAKDALFRRKYIASAGGMDFPRVLSDIAALKFNFETTSGNEGAQVR